MRLQRGLNQKEQFKRVTKNTWSRTRKSYDFKSRFTFWGPTPSLTLLMATLKKPKLLLLDEHTAAIDPKTASKVLETTDEIIKRNNLTTLMITHNMKDAIVHGNRLIMMMDGNIILDIKGEEKKKLTVEDLIHKFEEASGEEFASDKALLG